MSVRCLNLNILHHRGVFVLSVQSGAVHTCVFRGFLMALGTKGQSQNLSFVIAPTLIDCSFDLAYLFYKFLSYLNDTFSAETELL